MPFGNAQSLNNDEVYAITAYILYLNDLVDEDFELSHVNFEAITLPNEENFYLDNRENLENTTFNNRCMQNCKKSATITKRAVVLDVTPEEDITENNNVNENDNIEIASFDPNLIGGLVMQIESIMIDTSIKNKLKQIENKMIEA